MLQRYILFAILSTIVNLAIQYITLSLYSGQTSLLFAIFNGTASGLVLKYFLDKNYVFKYESKGKLQEGLLFVLYSLMGVFTTIIFWSVEIFFDFVFNYDGAKYVGAVVGLTIGYVVKFYLDKKYVFKK